MNKKPDLVLDIAGVIATNFSPGILGRFISKFAVSYDELIRFRKQVRKELGRGKLRKTNFGPC